MTLDLDRRSVLGGVGIAAGMVSLSGCAEGMNGLSFLPGSSEAPDLSSTEVQIKNIF